MVLAGAVCFRAETADAQAVSSLFIYPFNPAVSKISTAPSARWGLFRQADTIAISTTDNSPIRVLAMNGSVMYLGPPTSLQFAPGHYFVECNGDRDQFAVLPNDYVGASFLGTDADDGTDSQLTQRLAVINPSWVRTGNGEWAVVEAQQGVWNWTVMDQTIAANAGRKIIAYAGNLLPPWVNSNNFVASYTQVVQALASRYSNQLTALEVWNEPWYNKFPNTTNLDTFVAFYLQLQSQARQTVKAINPSIQVIGPAWSDFVQVESLAMTNSIGLFDGWSWHDYDRGDQAPDQDYDGNPNWVPILETDRLSYYFGNFATQKPLLVDELGLYGQSALGIANTSTQALYRSNLDWYRGMCRAIKTTVMYRACGVEAIIPHIFAFYAGEPNPNLELYGWDLSSTNGGIPRGPHPKTSAFLMTCYWLNGATLAGYRTPGTTNVFLYAWQLTNNTSIVFAWAPEGQTVPLQTSGLPQATDIYGRTNNITALTEEPAVFLSNDSDPLVLLSAVRSNLVGITNTAPVIDPLPTESVVAGQPLQITVSAADAERDPITYSATALPPGATFDPVTHTFSWTPGAGASGPYTATFVATDSLGASNSVTITITVLGNLFDGLWAHWKFDESTGTIAIDSAGTNNGTLTGFNFTTNSGWVSGLISNALSFDGVNDSVSIDSSQIILTNNFSFSVWLKPQDANGDHAFISISSLYETSGLRFFVYSNSLLLQGETTAGYQGATFANNAIQDGVWYHVAVIYDNSILSVYLNGALQGSTNWGGDLVMNTVWPSRIGTEGAYYFDGVIDDMMIFQRTLTVAQVQALYQSADQPPVFAPTGNQAVASGQTLAFTVSATDAIGSQMTYSAISLPAGASFNASTQGFTWTPTSGQLGNSTATFIASDGWLTSTQQVLILVTDSTQPDTTPPTLAVTGPGNYQVFATNTITVTGSATDASGIKGVTANGAAASVNGNNWSAPCSLAPGTNAITVIATDNSSNMNTASQVVYAVYNSTTNSTPPDTTPPTLAVTSPGNYQVFTNSAITVTGSATDASGIKGVTVNGVVASVNGSNWSAPCSLAPGTNAITVIATDNSSNMNTASQVVYAVYNSASSPPPNPGPVITTAPTITNAMLQVGNLAVVVAGDTNEFTVGATEPNGGTLNYTWMFGDDATSSPTQVGTASYVYTANCGPYTASVTVDDGTYSTNASFTVAIACQLTVSQLQGTLNFAKTNADTATIKATFALPADFSFTGQLVTLNIGGAQTSFTMDSKGRGLNGLSRFNKPSFNKKTGLWTFNAMLRNGSWHTPWAAYGLINATILKPGVSVTPPVILVIGDESFMAIPTRQYTSQAGKSGRTR
jgi:hypothetical protein